MTEEATVKLNGGIDLQSSNSVTSVPDEHGGPQYQQRLPNGLERTDPMHGQ